MSKRTNTSVNNSSGKRSRIDDLDDFWGDDLDGDAVDDCFRQATQILEEEHTTDVKLLSSYSIFKGANILTSTQCSQIRPQQNVDQVRDLQKKYAEKEGEVSILRTNLENLRTSYQLTHDKKEVEWKDKLNSIEKENKAVKCELEFKNLEIANLKQQISELSRVVNMEQNLTSQFVEKSLINSPKKPVKAVTNQSARVYVNVEKCTPLIGFSSWVNLEFPGNINNDLAILVNLSSEELNFDKYTLNINKILTVFSQMLVDFCDKLGEVKRKFLQETQEISTQYHISNCKISEISLRGGEILVFLAELLPFNKHLRGSLEHLLTVSTQIISLLGTLKLESDHCCFLSGFIKFVSKLFLSVDSNLKDSCVRDVLNHLLVLNLSFELMTQTIIFLCVFTRNPNFVSFLCSKHTSSKEICSFNSFISLFEKTLLRIENQNLLDVSSSILNLTYNVFKVNNVWLQQQELKTCKCIGVLYKLAIRTIYKNLEFCESDRVRFLVKNRMRILGLLTFSAYDLTQKYITDFAHFKEIMYVLGRKGEEVEQGSLRLLEKLSTTEDCPEVEREKFAAVDL